MSKMFVHYKGTVAEFKAANLESTYTNHIVFIKGGEANGNGEAVYTHGQYYANVKDALAALQTKVDGMKYFSKISDGTTTATVLAQSIVNGGLKNVTAGANPMVLKKGIAGAVDVAVKVAKGEEVEPKYGAKRCWMTSGTPGDCVKMAITAILEEDEKEQNIRKILNFGHTIGHAIESYYHLHDYYRIYKLYIPNQTWCISC